MSAPSISLPDLEQALQRDPTHARAHSNRGIARFHLGDLGAAAADLERAIELESTWAESYRYRGLLRAARGDRDGARADLEQAATLFRADGNFASLRLVQDDLAGLESARPAGATTGASR